MKLEKKYMVNRFSFLFYCLVLAILPIFVYGQQTNVIIGTYYFGGWAGHKTGSEAWDKNAPMSSTEKLENQFSNRKPIWGWRDDTDAIMKKQISLASKNGIDCFFFCWYWADNDRSINEKEISQRDLHDSMRRFMKASNNKKIKFALLVANHGGSVISGKDNWIAAIDYWCKSYFNHPSYLKIDGKPVISVFDSKAIAPYINEVRDETIKNGYPGIYIISCGYHSNEFDANSWYNIREAEPGGATERSYQSYTKFIEYVWDSKKTEKNIIPNVMVGWDQRPWDSKNSTLYFTKKSPKLFYNHLDSAFKYVFKNDIKPKMILIYAWNELGEGGYLVPTSEDPKGEYLQQIKKVKKKYKKLYNTK
jgi:hypothetical protein